MRERFVAFFDPGSDPLGAGYNVLQARISIGSGGWWGQGIGQGTQSQLEFLRVRDTDFIFAVLGEQLGFVGALGVILFFAILLIQAVVISIRARRKTLAATSPLALRACCSSNPSSTSA